MAVHKSYIGSGKEFIHYTPEELEEVRRTDMIDFLGRKEGFTFKRTGNYYKCNEHSSLVIYPNHQVWVWNSQNLKGLNCIDWLKKVDGYTFQEACAKMIKLDSVETTSFKKAYTPSKKEPVALDVPERAEGNFKNVYMYLTKTRNIDPTVVTHCFHKGIIYQDTHANAVFCGFDAEGNMKFAEKRGTNTFAKTKFRGNTAGSDKSYSFSMDCDKSLSGADIHRLYVFEAPIDLLSHCTLTKIAEINKYHDNADKDCWKKQNRLSLSGTSDVALEGYLSRNKDITEIHCCLDNDEGGIKGAEHIKEKFSDRYKVVIHRVKGCKDYNEVLQNYSNQKALEKQNTNVDNKTQSGDVSYISHSVRR